MIGVASKPEKLKDLFLTKEFNMAGIYNVKLYIRGKPYHFTVDDQILY